ncbi:hypothetical protein GCM10027590_67450 [Nocardiopsis nanhaiensis]
MCSFAGQTQPIESWGDLQQVRVIHGSTLPGANPRRLFNGPGSELPPEDGGEACTGRPWGASQH